MIQAAKLLVHIRGFKDPLWHDRKKQHSHITSRRKEETSHVIEYLERPQVNILQDTTGFHASAYFDATSY